MFLRLALVVEAHGTLVHSVGLHAILATETARVVWGDRAAVGKALSGQNVTLVKSSRTKVSGDNAPGDRDTGEAAQGATRHQMWHWVSSSVPAVWPLPAAGGQR